MPIAICRTDINGIFIDVNEIYTKIYGYTSQELIGKIFNILVPKQNRNSLLRQFN